MNRRYIVRDKHGTYQAGYNFIFGKDKAYQWAVQFAKSVGGTIYYVDSDKFYSNEEEVIKFNSK